MNLLSGLFVHQFFPNGISLENLHWQMSQEPSDVASRIRESVARGIIEPKEAENSRLKWAAMLDSDPSAWNGISLALEKIALSRTPMREDPVLNLWFRETDYASARAAGDFWREKAPEEGWGLDGETLRRVDPFFSNSFGLNCTVETADGKLLITRRSSGARDWTGLWHTSFNEGLSLEDLDPVAGLDPVKAFQRGLKEEIGIDPQHVPEFERRLTIHTLMLEVSLYQWGLLAHLDLNGTEFTSESILALRDQGAAADSWEASEVRFVEFDETPTSIVDEISNSAEWIPHGLLNVAQSTIVRFPESAREIREALAKPLNSQRAD